MGKKGIIPEPNNDKYSTPVLVVWSILARFFGHTPPTLGYSKTRFERSFAKMGIGDILNSPWLSTQLTSDICPNQCRIFVSHQVGNDILNVIISLIHIIGYFCFEYERIKYKYPFLNEIGNKVGACFLFSI